MIAASLWSAYCETLVTYVDSERFRRTLSPTDGELGAWPWGDKVTEVFILSPGNPLSKQLTELENYEREKKLIQLCEIAGAWYLQCIGITAAKDWSERSLMISGVPQSLIAQWGDDFAQNAMFRWTLKTFEVISLISDQHFATGWKLV